MWTTPIFFRLKGGQRAVGYDAKLLRMVCKVYQDLRDSLMKKLAKGTPEEAKTAKSTYTKYEHIITRCDELSHGFGLRGIEALVATRRVIKMTRSGRTSTASFRPTSLPLSSLGPGDSRTNSLGKPTDCLDGNMRWDRQSTTPTWGNS